MVAMHVHLSLAQTIGAPFNGAIEFSPTEYETSGYEPIALPQHTNAMTWPLLPGESVASLASLFYPSNPSLQRRFINKTLQLSRSIQPQLTADSIAVQPNLIVIPELKSLARSSGRIRPATTSVSATTPLKMSYGLKEATQFRDTLQFIVPQKLHAQYLQLVERNALLKAQLVKLNEHLVHLQQTLATLSEDARKLFSKSSTTPLAQQKTSEPTHGKLIGLVSPQTPVIPVNAQGPGEAYSLPGISNWLLGVILLLIGLLIAFVHQYQRRKSRQLYLASANTFDPIGNSALNEEARSFTRQAIDEVDFSLTQNGLSDSMSVTDLSQYDVLETGADGELVLEQAKIYAHIGRSDEAIELLRNHIDSKPKASLHHWLYLLDMFREAGQKEAFTEHAQSLHRNFNVMTPLWSDEAQPVNLASTLEAFPHIVQQLTDLWADPEKFVETQAYLDYLLTDNRDSVRTGFSMEVFQEIILLSDILAIRDKFNDAVKL
jgi:hypothetical protein